MRYSIVMRPTATSSPPPRSCPADVQSSIAPQRRLCQHQVTRFRQKLLTASTPTPPRCDTGGSPPRENNYGKIDQPTHKGVWCGYIHKSHTIGYNSSSVRCSPPTKGCGVDTQITHHRIQRQCSVHILYTTSRPNRNPPWCLIKGYTRLPTYTYSYGPRPPDRFRLSPPAFQSPCGVFATEQEK